MDINLLSKLIKESLFDQERVVISGIGYFFTEQISAKFSEDGKSILPPHLKISFKFEKNIYDDHLKKLFIHKTDAKLEEATAEWDAFLNDFQETLAKERKIEIPQIGELSYGSNGEVSFSTEDSGILFHTVYGLEQIPIKPLTNAVTTIEINHDLDIQDVSNEPEQNSGIEKEETPVENPHNESEQQAETDTAKETQEEASNDEAKVDSENEANSEIEKGETPIEDPGNESEQQTETNTEKEPQKKGHALRNTLIIIAAMIIILIAAIIILGQSGYLDNILYTPEELELIDKYGN